MFSCVDVSESSERLNALDLIPGGDTHFPHTQEPSQEAANLSLLQLNSYVWGKQWVFQLGLHTSYLTLVHEQRGLADRFFS
jgi:hypothetical protein